MCKKYEFTGETKIFECITLHRIRAIRSFGNVKSGDIGGWIENQINLDQESDAWVYDNAWVYGDALVSGDARVSGDALVFGDARVFNIKDIMSISCIGSRYGTTTIFKNKSGSLSVSCGCFYGTIDEFSNKVKETHGDSKFWREYIAMIEMANIHFEEESK